MTKRCFAWKNTAMLNRSPLSGGDFPAEMSLPRRAQDTPAWLRNSPFTDEITDVIQSLTPGAQLLLQAPTGTGKSTLLPHAMLQQGFCDQGVVCVVENRIEVAHQLAFRVAQLCGESVGGRVGVITAEQTKVSTDVRVLYVTAGVFARMLAENSNLAGVRAVLFDEFDERSMFMDLGFGLCRVAQQKGAQFSMALMSGTLDIPRLRSLLPDAAAMKFIVSNHELEKIFAERDYDFRDMPVEAAKLVGRILQRDTEGDILIFMPGHHTIKATAEAVRQIAGNEVDIVTMYSNLPPEVRSKMLVRGDRRTVKIATNIAERGLTIDGVRIVIDSGLERASLYDAARDSMSLITTECSKSSVAQRQGRANRTAPGEYYALFTEQNLAFRQERAAPEVLRGPLRSALLFARSSTQHRSLAEVAQLFPDSPSLEQLAAAQEQLIRLGALEHASPEIVSPLGTAMAELGCDPLDGARLLSASKRGNAGHMALLIAVSMSSNPWLEDREKPEASKAKHAQFFGRSDNDITGLIRVYHEARRHGFRRAWCQKNYLSRTALLQIDRQRFKLLRSLGAERQGNGPGKFNDLIVSLCETSPDRIYFRDSGNTFRNYLTLEPARLSPHSRAGIHDIIVAIDKITLQHSVESAAVPLITQACGVPKSFKLSEAVRSSISLVPFTSDELHALQKRCLPERFNSLREVFPDMILAVNILPEPFNDRGNFFLGCARIDVPGIGSWSTGSVRCASQEFMRHYLLKMLASEGEKMGLLIDEISSPRIFRTQPKQGGYLHGLEQYAARFGLIAPHFEEYPEGDSLKRSLTLDFGRYGEVSVAANVDGAASDEALAAQLWSTLHTMEQRGGLASFYLGMRQSDRAGNEEFEALFDELLKARNIFGVRFRDVPEASASGLSWTVEIQIPVGGHIYSIRGGKESTPARARLLACKAGYYLLLGLDS